MAFEVTQTTYHKKLLNAEIHDLRETIAAICNKDFTRLHSEPVAHKGNFPIYSVRVLDDKFNKLESRLLYTYQKEASGEWTLRILELLEHHEYDKSKALRGFVKLDAKDYADIEDIQTTLEFDGAAAEPVSVEWFNQSWLTLREEQSGVIARLSRQDSPKAHLVLGPPGAGKTLIGSSLIPALVEQATGESSVLFLAKSKALVSARKEELSQLYPTCFEQVEDVAREEPVHPVQIRCMTFNEWAISQGYNKCCDESDFARWIASDAYKAKAKQAGVHEIDAEYLYLQCLKAAEHKETQINADKVTTVLADYRKYLKAQHYLDLALSPTNTAIAKTVDTLIVDEFQDTNGVNTLPTLTQCLNQKTGLVLLGDMNQRLSMLSQPCRQVFTTWGASTETSTSTIDLKQSHRVPSGIRALANNILRQANKSRGGVVDKKSYTELPDSESAYEGQIYCDSKPTREHYQYVADTPGLMVLILDQKTPELTEKLRQHAQKNFGTKQVLTVKEAKGLESDVILYLDPSSLMKLEEHLARAQEGNSESSAHRSKQRSNQSEAVMQVELLLNSLFVGVTRSQHHVTVMVSKPAPILHEKLFSSVSHHPGAPSVPATEVHYSQWLKMVKDFTRNNPEGLLGQILDAWHKAFNSIKTKESDKAKREQLVEWLSKELTPGQQQTLWDIVELPATERPVDSATIPQVVEVPLKVAVEEPTEQASIQLPAEEIAAPKPIEDPEKQLEADKTAVAQSEAKKSPQTKKKKKKKKSGKKGGRGAIKNKNKAAPNDGEEAAAKLKDPAQEPEVKENEDIVTSISRAGKIYHSRSYGELNVIVKKQKRKNVTLSKLQLECEMAAVFRELVKYPINAERALELEIPIAMGFPVIFMTFDARIVSQVKKMEAANDTYNAYADSQLTQMLAFMIKYSSALDNKNKTIDEILNLIVAGFAFANVRHVFTTVLLTAIIDFRGYPADRRLSIMSSSDSLLDALELIDEEVSNNNIENICLENSISAMITKLDDGLSRRYVGYLDDIPQLESIAHFAEVWTECGVIQMMREEDINKLRHFIGSAIAVHSCSQENKSSAIFLASIRSLIQSFLSLNGRLDDLMFNITDEQAVTLLIHAISQENDKLVKMFIDAGAEVNHSFKRTTKNEVVIDMPEQMSPLLVAAECNFPRILKMLLDNGAGHQDPEQMKDAFICACRLGFEQVAELLLEHGADANAASHSGATPIFLAVESGNAALVQVLIDNDANPSELDYTGKYTTLHCAAQLEKIEVMKVLLNHVEPDVLTANKVHTPLMFACDEGKAAAAQLLLERGADPNAMDNKGHTGLTLAIRGRMAHQGDGPGAIDLVQTLIKFGANPVILNHKRDCTPLHLAAQLGDVATIKVIFDRFDRAVLNTTLSNGATALMLACNFGKAGVANWLLSKHANVSMVSTGGHTALALAKMFAEMHPDAMEARLMEALYEKLTPKQESSATQAASAKEHSFVTTDTDAAPPLIVHRAASVKPQSDSGVKSDKPRHRVRH